MSAVPDVIQILRAGRQQYLADVEQLALRLFNGERIEPTALVAELHRTGATDQQLQAEVDRLQRRAELRSTIAAAKGPRKQLATLEAERTRLNDAHAVTLAACDRFEREHGPTITGLHQLMQAAEQATSDLLLPKNLCAADRQALAAAERSHHDASRAESAAATAVQEAQHILDDRRRRLAEARQEAKANPFNDDMQAAVPRLETAVAARTDQLTNAEANAKAAAAATAAAAAKRREVEKRLQAEL